MPFKTAKINAAKQDFSLLLKEKNYSSTRLYSDGVLIDFANEVEFAKTAFNRFKLAIYSAPSHEEVAKLHFLDDEIFKKQIIHEIALKNIKFDEAKEAYHTKYNEILEHCPDKICEGLPEIKKLDGAWKKFQTQLINATEIETNALDFNPN